MLPLSADWPTCDQVTDDGQPCVGSERRPAAGAWPTWSRSAWTRCSPRWVTFTDTVSFSQARFGADATFRGVTFLEFAGYTGPNFTFDSDTTFPPGASFLAATFGGATTFEAVMCTGAGVFIEARFAGDVTFSTVTFTDGVDFDTATFDGPVRIERLTAGKPLLFDAAVFHQRVTRRQVIAEEHDAAARVHPRQVAGLYRQLRKAMEDNKNEPGAADFYYGEMQMRRRDPTAPAAERLILALYWLACGYGLRAVRALGVLAALVLLTAGGLQAAGFPHTHPGFGQSLLFAVQRVVSLDTTLPALQTLTWQGELLRTMLRLLGPLLLGLALLAIRNRVKR